MIKQKIGTCIDCEPEAGDKPLMAKRCTNAPSYHYQNFKGAKYQARSNQRKSAKIKRVAKNNNGLTLAQWFADQINQLPKHCENCDDYLNQYAPWMAHCFIAHIVPKRDFESVMVHPLNRLFLCETCHSKFDKSLGSEIVLMKCWPSAVERFKKFMDSIDPLELEHLQECFHDVFYANVSKIATNNTSTE